jgi:RNA polymerase sigma-70 factor (ECF subfamily)
LEKLKATSDQALLLLINNGDHLAFKEIFSRYSKLLYAHAYNKLRDSHEAHDVVQEVFSKLWLKRDQLDNGVNIGGYLFTSVRNQIFDLLRHKKVITSYEESFNKFEFENYLITDHLIREKQLAELIEKEISLLPPRMREVFNLRRIEHLSNKEIAIRMNIAESTVADQMKKALKVLRLKLGLLLIMVYYLNA